jgi:hypothetical protein
MEQITAISPAGEVTLLYGGRRLDLADGQEASAQIWFDWFLQSAFGLDGHIFYQNDCSLQDVLCAFGNTFSPDQAKRLKRLAGPLQPLPEGAIP